MIAFLVGLSVIVLIGVLAFLGALLMPVLLLLGIFARFILGLLLAIFVIWFIGKVTLALIEHLRQREETKH